MHEDGSRYEFHPDTRQHITPALKISILPMLIKCLSACVFKNENAMQESP